MKRNAKFEKKKKIICHTPTEAKKISGKIWRIWV
jgi:hypothetical protein